MVRKGDSDYEQYREKQAAISRERSRSGRDIGPLPPIKHPRRRKRVAKSFKTFCETYFSDVFDLSWSPDHLKVIAKMQRAIVDGGLFAMAMPRGTGKSSLCQCFCIWAMLTGLTQYIALIASDLSLAEDTLTVLKEHLEENDLLLEDYPEVCYPIRKLEGVRNRPAGQLLDGKPTKIGWKGKLLVLPTVEGSRASGVMVRVAGITGRIRGFFHRLPTGKMIRPDLVILDDPQTDESARSPSQCETRLRILNGAILNLCAPRKQITALMPCTVIQKGDMADNILDRKKHPEWQGERMQLVYQWPKAEKLWNTYKDLRLEGLRKEEGTGAATEFYRANRKAMDAGATAAWSEHYEEGELSALQHAVNLRLRDEVSFAAEQQNDPIEEKWGDVSLSAELVASKTNGLTHRVVPDVCEYLTAMVDVHQKLLYYTVTAWESQLTGYVVDYGTYPDQRRQAFTLADSKITMRHKAPRAGREGAIIAGVKSLVAELLSREWMREGGAPMQIGCLLCDSNWETDLVHAAITATGMAGRALPSRGRGIRSADRPLAEYTYKRGDRRGHQWGLFARAGRRLRVLEFDTNFWKSRIAAGFLSAQGDAGALTLWGSDSGRHYYYGQHQGAEYSIPTEGRGRRVDEWRNRPGDPDNHWFDCQVGCAVAASFLGARLPGTEKPPPAAKPRKRKSKPLF